MNFGDTNNKKAFGVSAVALALLLSNGAAALAQDAMLGDDLLPPEVVPLDPTTASSVQAPRATAPNAGAGAVATDGQVVPGLVNNGVPGNMQTAKDARAAAFNALYGQGQLQQQQPFAAGGVMQNQVPGMDPNANAMNGSGSGAYGSQVAAQPPMTASTQRLSGPTKNQPKIRDTKRGGLSNGISAVSAFGTGALLSGALMRNTNPMMGLGIFGLTMTGFGVRNAFRF
jgi:hypothetical protein